jgi:hypothetical protein
MKLSRQGLFVSERGDFRTHATEGIQGRKLTDTDRDAQLPLAMKNVRSRVEKVAWKTFAFFSLRFALDPIYFQSVVEPARIIRLVH